MPRSLATNTFFQKDFGTSLSLNGSTDFLVCPVMPAATGFSVMFWLKDVNSGINSRVISWKITSPNNNGVEMVKNSVLTDRYNVFMFDGGTTNANIGVVPLSVYVWNHITITFAPNDLKVYLNRNLVNTDTTCTLGTATSQNLTIGRVSNLSANFSRMLMDEFIIKNGTPFTQEEISDHYFNGNVPSGATAYYNFNNNVTDQSGNANNGTLTGGSYSTDVQYKLRSVASGRVLATNRITP
jgi:hypothetical protein